MSSYPKPKWQYATGYEANDPRFSAAVQKVIRAVLADQSVKATGGTEAR